MLRDEQTKSCFTVSFYHHGEVPLVIMWFVAVFFGLNY